MAERIVTVVPEAGLHARPASKFVQTANEFECDLQVAPADGDGNAADEPVDARSMLAVTSLGVGHDERVKLIAEGEDAEEALDALDGVLSTPEEGDSESGSNGGKG